MWQCRTLIVPVVLGVLAKCTQVLHGGWTLFQVITPAAFTENSASLIQF